MWKQEFETKDIRAGELSGLLISNVQLDRITVEQSVWGREEQAPKTQNAVRTIAISPQLAELLGRQIGRQKAASQTRLFSVSNGSPLDMNVERSRRLAPLLAKLDIDKAGYHAFRHFNVSLMDALRVPLKAIQERIGHALTGSFTLDVYGHTLDWTANEDAAKRLGREIAKAVAEVECKQQHFDSGHLSAHQKENFQAGNLEVVDFA